MRGYRIQIFERNWLKSSATALMSFTSWSFSLDGSLLYFKIDTAPGPQKVSKFYFFKVTFLCQKSTQFFRKIFSSKNINLGDHFLLKPFFSRLNFWTTSLSKIRPNFCKPNAMSIYKIQQFDLTTVDFWIKTLLFRTHQARNSMT